MVKESIERNKPAEGWDDIVKDCSIPIIDVMTQMRSGTQLLVSILLQSYKSRLIEFRNGILVKGDRMRVTKNVRGFNPDDSNDAKDLIILKRHHYHNRQYPLKYRLRIILLGDVERSLISDLYSLRQITNNGPVDYDQKEYFDELSKEWLLIKPYYDDLLAWYAEINALTKSEDTIIINELNQDSLAHIFNRIEAVVGLRPQSDLKSLTFQFPKKYSVHDVLSNPIIEYLDAFSNYTNI